MGTILRRRHLALVVFTVGLAACSTASQTSAPRPYVGGAVVGDGIGRECNVPPDSSRPQYIVGYGSLMEDESRRRTSPKADSPHPVEIRGYRRGWFARAEGAGLGATYLGVLPDRETRLNAVIYQVDATELAATDRREALYCRTSVAMPDIKPLEREFSPEDGAQTWIYMSKLQSAAPPDSRYPIVQSYVDIFVSGCLEQEQRFGLTEFSQQCISTTADWSEHWVNDRIHPRRPFVFQPRARQIDSLLSKQLPQYFSHIKIESGG